MRRRINQIREIVNNKNYSGYVILIVVGFSMAVGVFVKLMEWVYIDSDWFWLIAGVGLTVEGIVSLIKQRKFDKKYKIIEREEKQG